MPQPQTRVALLSIGDELLLGDTVDTNKSHIARQLPPVGLLVCRAETVGDEVGEIAAAFQRALACAGVVIATGGLGPTADDLTVEALAKALGLEIEFRPEVMEQMAARLKRPVEQLTGSNRKQALVPAGARILRNDWGTAPGIHLPVADGKHIFLMPGVPVEMRGLLRERILPLLRELFPAKQGLLIHKLHSYGIPESIVGERLKPIMQAGHNPDVGTCVSGGIVTVRLVAHGANLAEAQAALAPAIETARAALQEGLFAEGDENMASAALKALLARGKTVALAESCTAGLAAAMLGEIPGASAAFLEGAVVYSNAAKTRSCGVKRETLETFGAVSRETAVELARGVRARAGSDIGVSVTGIAGPGGGSAAKPVGLVYFGVSTADGIEQAIERNYAGMERNTLRERAAVQALDLIRRAALGLR